MNLGADAAKFLSNKYSDFRTFPRPKRSINWEGTGGAFFDNAIRRHASANPAPHALLLSSVPRSAFRLPRFPPNSVNLALQLDTGLYMHGAIALPQVSASPALPSQPASRT